MIVLLLVCKILIAAVIADSGEENACDPNPCQNGGICLNDCCCHCTNGFSGKYCELAPESSTLSESDGSSDSIENVWISSSSLLTSPEASTSLENGTKILSLIIETTNPYRSYSLPFTTSADSSLSTVSSTDKRATSTDSSLSTSTYKRAISTYSSLSTDSSTDNRTTSADSSLSTDFSTDKGATSTDSSLNTDSSTDKGATSTDSSLNTDSSTDKRATLTDSSLSTDSSTDKRATSTDFSWSTDSSTDKKATSTYTSLSTDSSSDKVTSTVNSEHSGLTSVVTRPSYEDATSEKNDLSTSQKDRSTFPEKKPETSREVCNSNPCQNGGSCYWQYDDEYERNYVCVCIGIFSGSNCERLTTESSEPTPEVSTEPFSSSHITIFTTEPNNLIEYTTNKHILSSSMDLSSERTSVAHEKGSTENFTNSTVTTEEFQTNTTNPFLELTNISTSSTESTEELQTNATISFHELNLTTTLTTPRISPQTIQSTQFSASSHQNSLPSSTESKEGITSFLTSSTGDINTSSLTTDDDDTIATLFDFINATRSTPDTRGGKNNGLPVAAYVGICVLSIILILILTGGFIYTKKFREKKVMLLFANGEDAASIINGSNYSFA